MLYSVPVGPREIVGEGAVAPCRVGRVDPTLPVPRRPDPIDVGVMQEEDRIAWRQHGGHVAGDRIVDSVVRGRFQHAHDQPSCAGCRQPGRSRCQSW